MLTDREKRCLTRAWDRREARVDKKFHNRHAYVKRRVAEVGEQCKRDGALLHRLHTATWEGVEILLFEGEAEHGSDAGDGTTADGPDPREEDSAAPISLAQLRRLNFQMVAVQGVLEEARTRDLLVEIHLKTALKEMSKSGDTADKAAMKALDDASLVRLDNSLLLIAQRVSEKMQKRFVPSTILSWVRQFRQLGGYFKRDARGVREREWILSEEDLSMELLAWLKAQKRVTTKKTQKFVNEELLSREGGLLKLATYGLSLPISTTTINVWMRKLGCKHDRVRQSYYTDGHERPDVQEARKDYLRKQRKLALRKPCWVAVEWSSLTQEEKDAFDERRETGPDAFSAETYHFEMDGKEFVEFHVDFLGGGDDVRHDALREGLGEEGGQYSVRFEKAAAAPCEHFHDPQVCKCHRKLYHIGQDESVYKAYAREGTEWVIRGVRGLRKKSEGPGEMVSAFQDETRGFGLPLSVEELARVNDTRRGKGRPPLKESPGTRFLVPGKNKEGYWTYDDFERQTIDIMDCLEEVEPEKQLAIEVDHSAGHAKYRPDGLHVANMNVKYGGKQKVLRDSVMTEGCLGPHEAKMHLNAGVWSTQYDAVLTTKTVDLKLKLGDVHRMSFGPDDPPPFYDWEAPARDQRTRTRRGNREQVKRGYVGEAKGSKQVLWERGWYVEGMSATAKDPEKNIEHVLSCLPDFKNERTALQHRVEKRGHILVLSPKFHPEVAGVGIEYSWGMSKLKFRREINDEVAKNLHANILRCFCRKTILTLARVRRFARRTRDYCRAYLELEKSPGGAESKDSIEKMRKACKAHRNIIDMEPGFIDTQ